MSKFIQEAIRTKKNYLINELIQLGIFKKGDKQLYELTLTELEEEYKMVVNQKDSKPVV